jgi:isopentenyl diphosphate isomerase/L-lactate dehydrogenase-like FMN-dependent dehydrogenase
LTPQRAGDKLLPLMGGHVNRLERPSGWSLNRRGVFRALAGVLASSPLLGAEQDPFRDHSRVPGLDEMRTVFDFEPVAYATLPRQVYDFTSYGADGEFTLRRNREVFDWVDLVSRGIVDVGSVSTSTEVLGTKLEYPIMVAPSAGHVALHPEGEVATHVGCTAAANTTLISSHVASLPIEKITAAAKGPVWFQLYPRRELDYNRKVLESVQAAGCRAVVVTVDQQASSFERRLHDRNLLGPTGRGPGPPAAAPRNPYGVADDRLWYEWKLFDDLRPFVHVPMLVKGIVTGEDARLCVEHGLDGIYVSNHGGRSVDYEPSTLEVLPEIVDAVKGKVPVIVDSGFRRGSDILKALALGASAVCVSRPQRWGLAAYGAPGVERVLQILQTELRLAMATTGRPTLASIDKTLVRTYFP